MTGPLERYPLLKKFFGQNEEMGIADMPRREMQDRSIELIDKEGAGTPAEREASMICAAVYVHSPSYYLNPDRFREGYSDDVRDTVDGIFMATPGSFMPPALAQAFAAAAIAEMEGIDRSLKTGPPPLTGSPAEILENVTEAFGCDMGVFAYLEAPALLSRFETTRDRLFADLKAAAGDTPPPRKRRPPNGDFAFT